jgi:hypothetical protein
MFLIDVIAVVSIIVCSMAVSMHNQCSTCEKVGSNINVFFSVALGVSVAALVGSVAFDVFTMTPDKRLDIVIPALIASIMSIITSSLAINMHNQCYDCGNKGLFYGFIGILVVALLAGVGAVVVGVRYGWESQNYY